MVDGIRYINITNSFSKIDCKVIKNGSKIVNRAKDRRRDKQTEKKKTTGTNKDLKVQLIS